MNSSTMPKQKQQTGKGLGKSVKTVGKNVKKAVTSKVGKTLTASAALLLLLSTLKNKKKKTKEEEKMIKEIQPIAKDENKAKAFLGTAALSASGLGVLAAKQAYNNHKHKGKPDGKGNKIYAF